jgi:hypothetical protein
MSRNSYSPRTFTPRSGPWSSLWTHSLDPCRHHCLLFLLDLFSLLTQLNTRKNLEWPFILLHSIPQVTSNVPYPSQFRIFCHRFLRCLSQTRKYHCRSYCFLSILSLNLVFTHLTDVDSPASKSLMKSPLRDPFGRSWSVWTSVVECV